MSVARLSKRVRRELNYLGYPSAEWIAPRVRDGARVLDVLVIGGGQSGLAIAFGLMRERITNIRIVDRNPAGLEGPWRRFARMAELRTAKEVTGLDFGMPSLTCRSWYEAKYGHRAWEMIDAIPPPIWQDYLEWYRDVLRLPVENEVDVIAIEPAGDLLLAHLRRRGQVERVPTRKIVLATGIDGSGRWRQPPKGLLGNLTAERYAHSADAIDFDRLGGKRVGVLGVGASAFDNAAVALEAGAARVDLCFRRADIPRVNPLVWANFSGMLGHFADLSPLQRWQFMRHMLDQLPAPPPQDSFWRCRRFENFAWHSNCAWHAIREHGDAVMVEAGAASFLFDFLIFATGFEIDLSARPELAALVDKIALWRHRFTPPPGEESEVLGNYPYLGKAFEFTERDPGTAPYLARLHNFTFAATLSLGVTGAAITGLKYGVSRLVGGLVRDLFREDAGTYYKHLLAYAEPELETLENPSVWINRIAVEALDARKLSDHLNQAAAAKALECEAAARGSGAARPEHTSGKPRAAPPKPRSGRRQQRKPLIP